MPSPVADKAKRLLDALPLKGQANDEAAREAARESLRAVKAQRRFFTVWAWVGAIILVVAAVNAVVVVSIPVGIILWTVVFVFLLRTPVAFLEKRGVPRLIGTIIAYLLLIAGLGVISFVVFSPQIGISNQFADLVANIPDYFRSLNNLFNDLYARYSNFLQNDQVKRTVNGIASSLINWTSSLAGSSAGTIVAAGTSIANIFITVGFSLVIAFWMLVDLPNLGAEVRRVFGPKYSDDLKMLHGSATRVMGGYIVGTAVQCAIIGGCCGVLFTVLGIQSPAALGVITGILNIIPIVGPWLGGLIAALMSLFISPVTALVALFGTIVIQQLVYTFVSPRIMSNAVDIHPALTLLALLAGSAIGSTTAGLMGALVGALLSIPVVALAKSVFVYYFERNTGRRIVSEEGVFFKGAPVSEDGFDPLSDATGEEVAQAERVAEALRQPEESPPILSEESQVAKVSIEMDEAGCLDRSQDLREGV